MVDVSTLLGTYMDRALYFPSGMEFRAFDAECRIALCEHLFILGIILFLFVLFYL